MRGADVEDVGDQGILDDLLGRVLVVFLDEVKEAVARHFIDLRVAVPRDPGLGWNAPHVWLCASPFLVCLNQGLLGCHGLLGLAIHDLADGFVNDVVILEGLVLQHQVVAGHD